MYNFSYLFTSPKCIHYFPHARAHKSYTRAQCRVTPPTDGSLNSWLLCAHF